MENNKAIIQRNLPLNEVYKIKSFMYISLIDGSGTTCENCGKIISNMVTIENSQSRCFVVGNDCAATLVKDKSKLYFEVEPAFNEGKTLRAKLIKRFKNKSIVDAHIYTVTTGVNIGKKYLVCRTDRGASGMQLINHFDVTFNYIKELLTS